MKNSQPIQTALPESAELLLSRVFVEPLNDHDEIEKAQQLLHQHHYLKDIQAVGERIFYGIFDENKQWLGVFVFTAAARSLRFREEWIGWSDEQRRRRLALVANNARFLLLPDRSVPNLGSVAMKLVLKRLSDDWQSRYAHRILVVETFVNLNLFQGTVYRASNFTELGLTKGYGRKSRDYYEQHNEPKALFVRQLHKNARRNLQAEKLKPDLAHVEEKVPPRCTLKSDELISLKDMFKSVPEYRKNLSAFPVYCLLAIMAVAHLSDAPRGQRDLAAFSKRLSNTQRRDLGVRRKADSSVYPAPSQSTWSRFMNKVDIDVVEEVLLKWQEKVRGPAPRDEVVAIDGKVPKHSGGKNVVTAVSSPSMHYLGCELVENKSNEIPAAEKLIERLDLEGQLVSLDAIHTQSKTARKIVIEKGGDYLLTVKGNQKGLAEQIENLIEQPEGFFLNSLSPLH